MPSFIANLRAHDDDGADILIAFDAEDAADALDRLSPFTAQKGWGAIGIVFLVPREAADLVIISESGATALEDADGRALSLDDAINRYAKLPTNGM